MACIESVRFTTNINGMPGLSFKGNRGLKQGDPLSPLLFVISMEYLTRLYKQAASQKGFKFHPHCKDLKMTHLMFADDLIVFSKADPTTIRFLMEAFHHFSACTGLKANEAKSQVVFGGVRNNLQECLDIINCPLGTLPFKYLGMPITTSKLSKQNVSSWWTKSQSAQHNGPQGTSHSQGGWH